MSQEFAVVVSPLLKLKVSLGADTVSWKFGLRKAAAIPLADVRHFGHRRLADGANGVVELLFVSKSGAKLPKLPFNPADAGAQALLRALAERLPEADTSRLSWLEAAPLLGMKPYGAGAYLRHPLFGAGLVLFLFGGPASFLSQELFGSDPKYQGIVVAAVMAVGVVMMIIGWQRVKADQRAELEAQASRARKA